MQPLLMVIAFVALLVAIFGLVALWWDARSTSLQEAANNMSESVKTEVYGPDGIAILLTASQQKSYDENSTGT